MSQATGYDLIPLPNGAHSIFSCASEEIFHPGVGPVEEGRQLYAEQLRLAERAAKFTGEFVIWDIGLGGAANACAAFHALRETNCRIRLISFDRTTEALDFALTYQQELAYFNGLEPRAAALLAEGHAAFSWGRSEVQWELVLDEIPRWLDGPAKAPAPDAILFDPCSPAKNPEMWTLPLFQSLFLRLDPARPCALSTYSRSTMIRVTLLLAGFHVGRGWPCGAKEETTLAANSLPLLADPLPATFLERVSISGAAEPMHEPSYRQAPLAPENWERLKAHPQFQK
jgi:tRNA U34 5-methylaminomethyl-2-thiouridine-forming methyltransferase MnmC